MSVIEKKLILLAMSKRRPNHMQSDLTLPLEIELSVSDWAAAYGDTDKKNIYRQLKSASESLFERSVLIPINSTAEKRIAWVDSCEYQEKKARIILKFGYSMSMYLTKFESYSEFELSKISQIKTYYGIRLFEILNMYFHESNTAKYALIDVEDFKKMCGLEDGTYRIFSDFKNRILTPAIEDVKKTGLIFNPDYETLKTGKKVSSIIFYKTKKEN